MWYLHMCTSEENDIAKQCLLSGLFQVLLVTSKLQIVMGLCTVRCKMLVYCVKTLRESCSLVLALLKKNKK